MDDPALPHYRLLHELDRCFDALVESIEHAADIYEQTNAATWHFQPPEARHGRQWFRQALLDMWHREGQDGRETRNYISLIAADEALLAALQDVNQCKAGISELLQRIKKSAPDALGEAKLRLPQRHPQVDLILRHTGMARLHLKQSWRQLPIASQAVSRVRFAWYSSGRSIKKLTVQEVEQKLLTLDSDAEHVRIQLRKLAGIPSGEVLAQVQTQAPLMRANLFFSEPTPDGHTRQAMNVAMPLIIPSTTGLLPHIKKPSEAPPEKRIRAKRRDEKLESEVFLPSLRIYRYR